MSLSKEEKASNAAALILVCQGNWDELVKHPAFIKYYVTELLKRQEKKDREGMLTENPLLVAMREDFDRQRAAEKERRENAEDRMTRRYFDLAMLDKRRQEILATPEHLRPNYPQPCC